ncbi:MAG TPA: hypothetical protein VLH13_03025, partial [Methanomassiliicoccales archaeon]|nr:hypothetical protein [Methanomassiliicoccales archaeon]
MFKFQSKQETFQIGDVNFGGQPGKRRTVMVGSLFYPKHGMVQDRLEGRVDMGRLQKALEQLDKG